MKMGWAEGYQLWYRRRSWSRAMLSGIVSLLVFSSLLGCAEAKNSITGSLTSTPTTLSQQGTAEPRLLWSDEFDGPKGASPDPGKWTSRIGGEGWGNNQLDYDTAKNAYQDGQGNLVIEARQENPPGSTCWYGPCKYTSAQITNEGHFSFTYGRLEARIKIPSGQGIWSAFWLFGANCDKVGWPACGEIDVMENIGREPSIVHGTAHGPNKSDYSGTYDVRPGVAASDFHIYALQWDADHLYYFFDGINYYTLDRNKLENPSDWAYNHPFYIVLNVAVGGTWPGKPDASTVFPQKMYVSYVRLYANK